MQNYVVKPALFLCLAISSVLCVGQIPEIDSRVAISETFRMETIEDEKLSELKLIVTLQIFGHIHEPYVVWNHVCIEPDHDKKRVLLRAGHFSVEAGTVKNVIVDEDSFSFQIHPSLSETMQIVGTKNAGESGYSVQGVGLVYLRTVSKRTKMEWQSTDRKFILPYKEVY